MKLCKYTLQSISDLVNSLIIKGIEEGVVPLDLLKFLCNSVASRMRLLISCSRLSLLGLSFHSLCPSNKTDSVSSFESSSSSCSFLLLELGVGSTINQPILSMYTSTHA